MRALKQIIVAILLSASVSILPELSYANTPPQRCAEKCINYYSHECVSTDDPCSFDAGGFKNYTCRKFCQL